MILNSSEIVDDNMVEVEGYEEIVPMEDYDVTTDVTEEMTYEDDDERDIDGYGGLPVDMYNDIVEYKRTNIVPHTIDKRNDRSAPSHWRSRCNRFIMADDGETLLYYNPTSAVNDQPKVVVKKGEVKKVLERIHELIGHLGQKRTQMVVLRKLYWRSVRQDVKTFISSCDFCNRKKLEGRKIVKAPVDITSDTFDITVAIRDRSREGERLELTLVGYNEQDVREAAYTRMTSYTFKETANEYRSRFTLREPPASSFRRQPYVKRNGNDSMALGFLLPLQHRSRALEPEFIEILPDRVPDGYEGDEYEHVVEEIDSMEHARLKRMEDDEAPHPITIDGQLLQAKRYFKEEEADVDVVADHGDMTMKVAKDEPDQHIDIEQQGLHPSPAEEDHRRVIKRQDANRRTQMSTRYGGKRSVPVHHEDEYERRNTRVGPSSSTTTASLVKKRRKNGPSIQGMASRFSLAIGDSDRIGDERNSHEMIHGFDGLSSNRPELSGLPPVCLMPSLDPSVVLLQKEVLTRHIKLQKMQEKVLQAQYDSAIRIPLNRFVHPSEHHVVQDEAIEVDHELNVMDDGYE